MKTIPNIISTALLTVMTGCVISPIEKDIPNGSRLPSFSVVTNDGQVVCTQDFDEGYGLIVFFYTCCPDCQLELPVVQSLYEKHGDAVRFLAISRYEDKEDVSRYWKSNGLTVPFSPQNDDTVFHLFARHTIPRTYLIHDGIIISQWDDNPIMTEQDFASIIRL